MVLSVLPAVVVARFVSDIAPAGYGFASYVIGVVVLLLAGGLLTHLGPLAFPAWLHVLVWLAVGVLSLFISLPLGVLGLTGLLLATVGRRLGRIPKPRTVGQFLRSPLPWVVLTICLLLGLAYDAVPPVGFPGAAVSTPSGQQVGGYLARTPGGVHQVLCTSLANATSTNERIVFIPDGRLHRLRISGTDYLDSGARPSLLGLALDVLQVKPRPPTIFSPALRAAQPTCAEARNAPLTVGQDAPRLGAGVIEGTAPASGRATDGESPIGQTAPTGIGNLARRYAPTLLVTVADANWPVSLGAVLAGRGPTGSSSCLIQSRTPHTVCPASSADLSGPGSRSSDYLQLPVMLSKDHSPISQFDAFRRGLGITPGSTTAWLTDPGRLDPWASAEFYFYYAGTISSTRWPAGLAHPSLAPGLIGLEYWFYYPYNYYPSVVDAHLMDGAPWAGDHLNTDLHQGDWEHVDVLLNPQTHRAEWLYLARHSNEGVFIPWASPSLHFDHGHPVIQAAFGGHPSYLPGCGAQTPRAVTYNLSSDWLVCGSGRFAFRGANTPLVDLARTGWACWPGYFGEARTSLEVQAAGQPESIVDTLRHLVFVAGPRSPLRQGENAGVCDANPLAAEKSAVSGSG